VQYLQYSNISLCFEWINTAVEMAFRKTSVIDVYVFSNTSDNESSYIIVVNVYNIKLPVEIGKH